MLLVNSKLYSLVFLLIQTCGKVIDLSNDCSQKGILSPKDLTGKTIELRGCSDSFFTFRFIPTKTALENKYKTILSEGKEKLRLIKFENEILPENDFKLKSGLSSVFIETTIGEPSFNLEYFGHPLAEPKDLSYSYDSGDFIIDSIVPEGKPQAEGPPLRGMLDLQILIHTGNGRTGVINCGNAQLSLNFKNTNMTSIKIIRQKLIQTDGEKIRGNYNLGSEEILTTTTSPTIPPIIFPDHDSFQLFFMAIDKKSFGKGPLSFFKSKVISLMNDINEESSMNCSVLYKPQESLYDCSRKCGMSSDPSRGCGSLKMAVHRDAALCPIYDTSSFKILLEKHLDDLSIKLNARILKDDCLTILGLDLVGVITGGPILLIALLIGVILLGILGYRIYEKKKLRLRPDRKRYSNHSNELEMNGIDNKGFFREVESEE